MSYPAWEWTVAPGPNRKNLHLWLERYHARVLCVSRSKPSAKKPNSLSSLIIGTMFHVVEHTRDKQWQDVETLLEEHYGLLEQFDDRWAR
jgi:hypothetical protein